MKSIRRLSILFSLAIFSTTIYGQKNVQVTIIITDLHLKYSLKGGTDPRILFFDKRNNALLNSKDAEGFNCLHLVDYKQQDAAFEYNLITTDLDLTTSSVLNVKMEAFEKNKKKGGCEFDGSGLFNKDKNHEFGELIIDLKKIQPGIISPKFTASTQGGLFSIEYKVKYSLPAADPIKTDEVSGKYCSDKKVVLRTSPGILPNTEGVLYKWEYQVPKSDKWELLTTTDQPETEFAVDAITKEFLKNNFKVPIRVSLFTKEELGLPVTKVVEFMPASPTINIKDIIVANTCKDATEGTVWVNNIKGVTQNYLMVVRPAFGESTICFPDNPAMPCKETDKVKATEQINDHINGLGKGQYKLYLTNNDQNKGACYLSYPVTINEHPKLEELKRSVKAVSCNALDDGEITVSMKGGNPGALTASISPQMGIVEIDNRTVRVKKLSSGKYQLSITDSCGQKIDVSATIAEPPPVKIDISNITKSTCNETPNGSFTVTINQGVGPFRYILVTREGTQVYKSDKTNMPSWIFNNLSSAEYRVMVYSNGSDSCKPVEKRIIIEGTALEAEVKLVKNIQATCDDCKNGVLQFAAPDHKGVLQFILTNTITNQVYSNTTGLFDNLTQGKYILSLKRGDTNCGDMQKFSEVYTIIAGGVTIGTDTTIKQQ